MHDYRLILRTQVAATLRFGRGGRGVATTVLGLAFVVGIAGVMIFGSLSIFALTVEIAADYPELAAAVEDNLLSLWALLTIVVVLSNALNTTYASLYRSDDTGFLLSMPFRAESVFAARLTGNMLSYVAISFPITYGPYIAYGVAHHAGPGYHFVTAVGYLGFLTLLVALGALFITLVMAYIPGARLKQWLMVGGLAMGLAVVFGTQVVAGGLEQNGSLVELLRGVGGLRLGGFPLWPHVWLVRTATCAVDGGGLGYMTIILLAAAALSAVLIRFAGRVYTIGWAGGQEVERRRASRRRSLDPVSAAIPAGRSALATPFWATLRKDLLIGVRTPVQWYLVAVGAMIVAFQVINVTRSFGARQTVPEDSVLLLLGVLLLGAGISSSVMAGSAFSREGANVQLLNSWPMSPGTLFAGKVAAALPVPLAMSGLGLVAVGLLTPVGLAVALRYLPVLPFVLVPMSSLLACIDAFFPDFRFERGFEAGAAGSTGSVTKTLISIYGGMLVILLLIGTFNLPAYHTRFILTSDLSATEARWLAYIAFGIESAGLTLGGLAVGKRRIPALTGKDVSDT